MDKLIPINYVMDALFVHDYEPDCLGKFLEVNEIACDRLGYTKAELLEMTPLDLDLRPSVIDIQHVIDDLKQGRTTLFEQIHVTKDGQTIPVEVHAKPVVWDGKKVVVSIVRNVAARKQSEIAQKSSNESFRLAFENALTGNAMFDLNGDIARVNKTFAHMLGYSPSEIIKVKVLDIIDIPDTAQINSMMQNLLNSKQTTVRHNIRFLHRNGYVIWGDIGLSLLRNPDDNSPRCFLAQVLDVTARVEADKLIQQNQVNLELMVEERTKKLQESNQALQSFAYATSHDLREPLIKITAFGQRLEDMYSAGLDTKGRQYLEIMQTAASRMLHLIDDLLAYSKVGREQSPLTNVDLNEILDDVLSDLEVAIQNSNAQVKVIGTLPTIKAHRVQIRQVFQNLISNAIKFKKSDTPPVIEISNETQNCKGVIRIKDNGIGFDNAHAEQIFTIFTRLHTRFDYPGTGIGLAICRRILTQYGGTIQAEGESGKGSVFTIEVPTLLSINRVHTVIVVDDHDVVRRGLESTISLDSDLSFIGGVRDARSALDMVRKLQPDIVIMDVNLPGKMDGVTATKKILSKFPNTIIIGLSIGPHDVVGPLMLKAGAKAYIKKEESIQNLVSIIKQHFANRGDCDGQE